MQTIPEPYVNGDAFSALCGMRITHMEKNYAEACVTISEKHLNLLKIPHGGIYFVLADFVFGAAVDYLSVNMVTLNASIEFLASANLGDVLTAVSRDTGSTRTIIRHDITITNQDAKVMAVVHCTGYKKGRNKGERSTN